MNEQGSLKKRRAAELDFFRGLCILLMILDHFVIFWVHADALGLFSSASASFLLWGDWLSALYASSARMILRNVVICVFFLIAGATSVFSKSAPKRALRLFAFAQLLTAVTGLVRFFCGWDFFVLFGVIHAYAACVLAWFFLRKIKNNTIKTTLIFLIFLSCAAILIFQPQLPNTGILMWLGIPGKTISTGFDYFPLLPWLGIFITGALIGEAVYTERNGFAFFEKKIFTPFSFVGRHGLWFYALHIPAVALLIYLLFLFL